MKETDNNITLRKANPNDAEVMCRFWVKLIKEHEALDHRIVLSDDAALRWKNDFPLWIEDQTRRFILVEQAGRPIGYIQAHRRLEAPIFQRKPEVYIDEIYVLPTFRQQGIGKKLLEDIKQWADQVGAEQIRLKVLSANAKGIEFWEREGAVMIDVTYTIELETKPDEVKEVRMGKLGF